jgi:hypothetical protein
MISLSQIATLPIDVLTVLPRRFETLKNIQVTMKQRRVYPDLACNRKVVSSNPARKHSNFSRRLAIRAAKFGPKPAPYLGQ